MGLVEETAVAAPGNRAAVAAQVVGHAEARREVVGVDRVLGRIREGGIVAFVERLHLEVVAQAGADGRAARQVPLVLHEHRAEMRFLVRVQGVRHADLQPFGIGGPAGGVERGV